MLVSKYQSNEDGLDYIDVMHYSEDEQVTIEVFGLLKVAEQHFYENLFGVEYE